jgi:menaquinone-9 beta-reductase
MTEAGTYDLIIVGGGLAGSTLAKVMAESGARVLVLERERQFRDRVRGEGLHPWGVSEAKALNIYDRMMAAGANEARWWARSLGGRPTNRRDFIETTSHRSGELTFSHPVMQSELIRLAEEAGAEIRRGALVRDVRTGSEPEVSVELDGIATRLTARLVVGADGRRSQVRRWAGFSVSRDPDRLRITGALLENMAIEEDAIHIFGPPSFGQVTLLFPLGRKRVRVYFITARRSEHLWLSGPGHLPEFIQYCAKSGTPVDWFEGIELAGPLATFEGADMWVEHPSGRGVVLVGDAAAASDPSWGCGMSLTLRDARTLRDALLADDNWERACEHYAREHDGYFGSLHTIESWMTEILYGIGPEADRIRAHALPLLAAGKGPDSSGEGPDYPTDEAARIAFLGA